MIKRKSKWKLTTLCCILCCMFCSLSVPAFAKTDSPKTAQGDRQEEIGVYAKRKESTASEYTATVQEKKAELTADGNITFKVSKAPSKAVTLVVYYIPETETEAWSWFNECLEKEKLSVKPMHIMDVYFLDESGSRISAEGAELAISCKHCGTIQKICTVDTDGNVGELWNASETKKQAAFTANGSHYYIIAEKTDSDNGNNDNNNNNNGDNIPGDDNTGNDNKPGDNNNNDNDNHQPDNTPDSDKPSNNKPGNTPDGNKPSDNKPGNRPNGGNQSEQKPDSRDKPYIEGKSEVNGWENIKEQLDSAKEKDTITVGMNGTTVVPGDVFDTIKGKDITIVFDMGDGIFWTVNGKDITADKVGNINFGVIVGEEAGKTIPVEIINKMTGERYSMNLTLSYDGEFGFTAVLTLNVDKENAGLFANLFYYNPASGELEYICADKIDEEGNASLKFTHASDYVVVIDTEDMQTAQNTDITGNGENAENNPQLQENAPADSRNTVLSIVVLLLAVMVLLAGSVWYVLRKKENKKA